MNRNETNRRNKEETDGMISVALIRWARANQPAAWALSRIERKKPIIIVLPFLIGIAQNSKPDKVSAAFIICYYLLNQNPRPRRDQDQVLSRCAVVIWLRLCAHTFQPSARVPPSGYLWVIYQNWVDDCGNRLNPDALHRDRQPQAGSVWVQCVDSVSGVRFLFSIPSSGLFGRRKQESYRS